MKAMLSPHFSRNHYWDEVRSLVDSVVLSMNSIAGLFVLRSDGARCAVSCLSVGVLASVISSRS
ncbi:hypothetical protein BURKHO8Y_110397 [Burkholderia sp. 8Y]|nr:hypothetical protein BURKHO8Y_110397 [Burkholderia sp. 8Y]